MPENKIGFQQIGKQADAKSKLWNNPRERRKIIHKIPDPFQALIIELDDKSMNDDEVSVFFKRMMRGGPGRQGQKMAQKVEERFKKCLQKCESMNLVIKTDDTYSLTEGGKEIAAYFKKVIPMFFKLIFSPRTVSGITIIVHAILSVLKFVFGLLSASGGLISDAIDNCADTAASAGIWLGIKYRKERLASLLIIVMMFVSAAGVFYAGIEKIINPSPISGGLAALIVSFICGLVMLGLSAYQYMAGKKTANFAYLCQAADSRNHFITSLLVCAGIALSFAASNFKAPFLRYADAAIALIIGVVIFKSSIELIIEYAKGGQADTSNVKHFIGTSIASARRRIILKWLEEKDLDKTYRGQELADEFRTYFNENTPALFKLIELDFHSVSEDDFIFHLRAIAKSGKIKIKD